MDNTRQTEKVKALVEAEERELCILVTEADKTGRSIAEMSDFFEGYIQQISHDLIENVPFEVVREMPFADLGVLNDIIDGTKKLMTEEYSLVPDFDSLSSDIKTKLKKGIYSIGKSKQVEENWRAVIFNEKGRRIKDITLKRVKNNIWTVENIRSITNQMQMKQISAKLDSILEYQEYQLRRDRDRDMVTPFFVARSHILKAQESKDKQYQIEELNKAADKLEEAINSIYTDMSTVADKLAKLTNRIFITNNRQKNIYMEYLIDDLRMATKFVGVQMQVYEFLGDKSAATIALESYQQVIKDFTTKPINKNGLSATGIMQNNYPYSKENRDFWYEFTNDVQPLIEMDIRKQIKADLYIVSMEDATDV